MIKVELKNNRNWSPADNLTVGRDNLKEHISTFLFGLIVAIFYSEIKQLPRFDELLNNRIIRYISNLMGYILLMFMVSIITKSGLYNCRYINLYIDYPGSPFISLPISLMIIKEILFPGIFAEFFELWILRFAGKISYSIYLLHMLCIRNIFKFSFQQYENPDFDQNGTLLLSSNAIFIFISTFVISTVAYYLIEYPIQMCSNKLCRCLNDWILKRNLKWKNF